MGAKCLHGGHEAIGSLHVRRRAVKAELCTVAPLHTATSTLQRTHWSCNGLIAYTHY